MTQAPLANKGNYLHIYDFRVAGRPRKTSSSGCSRSFDYSDGNPMHKSSAQVEGTACFCRDRRRSAAFFLIAEWS